MKTNKKRWRVFATNVQRTNAAGQVTHAGHGSWVFDASTSKNAEQQFNRRMKNLGWTVTKVNSEMIGQSARKKSRRSITL